MAAVEFKRRRFLAKQNSYALSTALYEQLRDRLLLAIASNDTEFLRSNEAKFWHLHASCHYHEDNPGPQERLPLPVEEVSLSYAIFGMYNTLRGVFRAYGYRAMQPVTTGLIYTCVNVFLAPGGVPLRRVTLSPYCVVQKRDLYRLFTSAVVHMDAIHMLNNLSSSMGDCVFLEICEGSAKFALDLVALTALSSGFQVALAWLKRKVWMERIHYFNGGAVGFSAVSFALEVLAGSKYDYTASFYSIPIHARYAWVSSLINTHARSLEASFRGHMCGVAAGVTWAYVFTPLIRRLRRSHAAETEDVPQRKRLWLRRLLTQAALMAATTAGFVVTRRPVEMLHSILNTRFNLLWSATYTFYRVYRILKN